MAHTGACEHSARYGNVCMSCGDVAEAWWKPVLRGEKTWHKVVLVGGVFLLLLAITCAIVTPIILSGFHCNNCGG